VTASISEKWDRIYSARTEFPLPSQVLIDNAHLLPSVGLVLDLACGLGGNALYLAKKGLEVKAWDISPVAVKKLRKKSQEQGFLNLDAQVVDVENFDWPKAKFDVIIVSRFLQRFLCPLIFEAIKPGGLLFYQTFTQEKVSEIGPSNPEYLLGKNELLRLFPDVILRVYREEGRLGDLSQGFRNEAYLVGQKPL